MRGEIIQGLDIEDIVKFVSRKKRVFIRVSLDDLENVLGKDTEQYKEVRKIFLNNFNDYERSVLRAIFGNDFEGTIK